MPMKVIMSSVPGYQLSPLAFHAAMVSFGFGLVHQLNLSLMGASTASAVPLDSTGKMQPPQTDVFAFSPDDIPPAMLQSRLPTGLFASAEGGVTGIPRGQLPIRYNLFAPGGGAAGVTDPTKYLRCGKHTTVSVRLLTVLLHLAAVEKTTGGALEIMRDDVIHFILDEESTALVTADSAEKYLAIFKDELGLFQPKNTKDQKRWYHFLVSVLITGRALKYFIRESNGGILALDYKQRKGMRMRILESLSKLSVKTTEEIVAKMGDDLINEIRRRGIIDESFLSLITPETPRNTTEGISPLSAEPTEVAVSDEKSAEKIAAGHNGTSTTPYLPSLLAKELLTIAHITSQRDAVKENLFGRFLSALVSQIRLDGFDGRIKALEIESGRDYHTIEEMVRRGIDVTVLVRNTNTISLLMSDPWFKEQMSQRKLSITNSSACLSGEFRIIIVKAPDAANTIAEAIISTASRLLEEGGYLIIKTAATELYLHPLTNRTSEWEMIGSITAQKTRILPRPDEGELPSDGFAVFRKKRATS